MVSGKQIMFFVKKHTMSACMPGSRNDPHARCDLGILAVEHLERRARKVDRLRRQRIVERHSGGVALRLLHEDRRRLPDGVAVELTDPTTIVIRGADKQKVGQFAAEIRRVRKPEPYKAKGIRYENEQVRRKEGKSFTSGG